MSPFVAFWPPSKSDLWQSEGPVGSFLGPVFPPSKSDLWQSKQWFYTRANKFSCPQKVIYGKARARCPHPRSRFPPSKSDLWQSRNFHPVDFQRKTMEPSGWGQGGFAKGRRIFVVSKSENLFVCRMPFFRAIIKRKFAIFALSPPWTDGGVRPPSHGPSLSPSSRTLGELGELCMKPRGLTDNARAKKILGTRGRREWFQGFEDGRGGGARTHDPLIKSQLLFQLSYASINDFLHYSVCMPGVKFFFGIFSGRKKGEGKVQRRVERTGRGRVSKGGVFSACSRRRAEAKAS